MSQLQTITLILALKAKQDALNDFMSDVFWDSFPTLN